MPIVDVELVVAGDGTVADGLAQSLADAVGRTLRSPPGRTWVRLRLLAQDRYAENGEARTPVELPVFATILQREPPGGRALADEMSALAGAIAQTTGRPMSCVHVEYAPAAAGRIGFGGRLVE